VSFGRGGDARDEIIIPLGCFRRGPDTVNLAVVDPRGWPCLALIGKVLKLSTGCMGSCAAGAFGAVCATLISSIGATGTRTFGTRARRLKISYKVRMRRNHPTR
jgi:hypothetical protein